MSISATISVATSPIEIGRHAGIFRMALRQVLAKHRFLITLVLVYAACGALVLAWSKDSAVGALLTNFPLIVTGNTVLVASVAAFWTIGLLAQARPAHPFSAAKRAFSQSHIWPQALARGVILVPATAMVTGTFSAIKAGIPDLQAFAFDETFIAWDAALHGGLQPWELLQPLLGTPGMTRFLDQVYYLWFPILYHTFYWQIFTKRRPVLRLQFITAFLLSWMIIGSAAAVAMSSAGPAFLVGLGLEASAFTGLFDYLGSVDARIEVFALSVQDMLWQAYAEGVAMPFEGISAMPSMHVAIAFLLAVFGWRRHWLLGIAYSLFAVLIFLGSIHLGFHYAVDGYVAVLMVVIIWWGSAKIARRTLRPALGARA